MQEAVNLRERADLLEPLAHLRVRGRELRDLGLEIRQLRVEQLPLDGRAECVAVLVARSHHDCGEAQRQAHVQHEVARARISPSAPHARRLAQRGCHAQLSCLRALLLTAELLAVRERLLL